MLAISGMLLPDGLPRQDKLCYSVPFYQLQIPSRPGCCVDVSLPTLNIQGLFPRTGTGLTGISPDGYDVLSCRQVATIIITLAESSDVLAIDGNDKTQILPETRHPVNKHMP